MRNIGDKIFKGSYKRDEKHVTCPDCFGKLRLTVILGDGEKVSIPCQTCVSGNSPPSGVVPTYEFETVVEQHTITGMEINQADVEYHLDGTSSSWYLGRPHELFDTKEEAQKYAESKRTEYQQKENKRLGPKEKDFYSWASDVAYYRRELERAEREVERFREKLGIAKEKSK